MRMFFDDDDPKDADACPAVRYLRREPENLVVNGYRSWILGLIEKDAAHWEQAWNAHARSLGSDAARIALDGLQELIRTLGACATCPLRFHKPDTGHLCRDECLILGLIAGLQHGDEDAAWQSATGLSCAAKCGQVMAASGTYAFSLKHADRVLLPVPAAAIRDIELQSAQRSASTTLH